MQKVTERTQLDIIIPISLELDWVDKRVTVAEILEQYHEFGFRRFALAAPCGGWRSVGYPPDTFFEERAALFADIKRDLEPYGIECGWWNTLTVKSGKTEGIQSIVKADGQEHPFANCPLDEAFRDRMAKSCALFVKIAKPAFIIFEDDYSVNAAGGCYCETHLMEFEKRCGRRYTREELTGILAQTTPEALAIARNWRELLKDSLVGLAKRIREEVDKDSPEIPMGTMESGSADTDGGAEEVARALAGDKHTPFSRLFGIWYGDIPTRKMGVMLYHVLYNKQHFKEDFACYYEADTYPHTRFYTAARKMKAVMGTVFSYGMVGATFQTQQLLDDPNEEKAYGYMFAKERRRFNAVYEAAKQCRIKGVTVEYDPFYNTISDSADKVNPQWIECVSRFGIPHTTTRSEVVFWDDRQAKFAEDAEIREVLSRTVFLDGAAAKRLCDRGYGELLGVSVGEDIARGNNLSYDLGAREVIGYNFAKTKGKNMTSAWMYCPQRNGKMLSLTVTNPTCQVITRMFRFDKKCLGPAMTRFENSLGGKVVVMGLTLEDNHSQALFNYRRKALIQSLVTWGCDEYAMVKGGADVMITENVAQDPAAAGFYEMLTLVNTTEDDLEQVALRLPASLREGHTFFSLNQEGEWEPLTCEKTEDGIVLPTLGYCEPAYILIK